MNDPGVVASTANTESANASHAEEYITMSVAFLHSQIDFGLQHIVHANELISYYEAQVAKYHLLLMLVSILDQKKKRNNNKNTNETRPSGIQNEEEEFEGGGH